MSRICPPALYFQQLTKLQGPGYILFVFGIYSGYAASVRACQGRFSMRLSPVYLCLAATAVLLSGCGNSKHIGCSGTDACVEQSFVYATTNAGQVLIFPIAQNGTLSTPTSVPGPAITGGSIAVSPPSHELFVGDHVLDTVAAFVLIGTKYQAAP